MVSLFLLLTVILAKPASLHLRGISFSILYITLITSAALMILLTQATEALYIHFASNHTPFLLVIAFFIFSPEIIKFLSTPSL